MDPGLTAGEFGALLNERIVGLHALDLRSAFPSSADVAIAWRPDGTSVLTVRLYPVEPPSPMHVAYVADLEWEEGTCIAASAPLRRLMGP